MTFKIYKRLTLILGLLCVTLLVSNVYSWWRYKELTLRIKFADEQTRLFDEMREWALKIDSDPASGTLYYVMHYYPSGTKQEAGSSLDMIVERGRASAVREIIKHLRATGDEDFGNNPKAWFDAYVPGEMR